MERLARNTFIVASLLAVALACILYFGSRPATDRPPHVEPPATPIKTNGELSRDKCEELVTGQLKAPATAQFHTEVTPLDDAGPWTITGTVDSENSFGALLRTRFACTGVLQEDGKILTTLTGVL